MKIVSCVYGKDSEEYRRQLLVFLYSVKKNSNLDVILYHTSLDNEIKTLISDKFKNVELKEMPDKKFPSQQKSSTKKMFFWNEIIKDLDEKEQYAFMDCDIVVLGDVSSAFENEFDIAFTYRSPNSKYRLNAGVIFIRNNEKVKALFQKWYDKTLGDSEKGLFRFYEKRYGSIDQGVLCEMVNIDRNYHETRTEVIDGLKIMGLPCSIYNESDDWQEEISGCLAVHLKAGWRVLICAGREYSSMEEACSYPPWSKLDEGRKTQIKSWKWGLKLWNEYRKETEEFLCLNLI